MDKPDYYYMTTERWFDKIMEENNYQKSKAVEVHLRIAKHYATIVNSLVKNLKDQSESTQAKLYIFINQNNDKRIKKMWDAVDTAKLEKIQGWKFVEDGETFIYYLQVKYKGNLRKVSHEESMQIDLITWYDQAYRKQVSEGILLA